MDTVHLIMWERVQSIASSLSCKLVLRDRIEIYDKKGLTLGHFDTVQEAYAFMCGYEHKGKK